MGINEALQIVGDDTMGNLFSFCEMRAEMADPYKDLLDFVEAYQVVANVGLAIYGYAKNKEKICRE